MRFRPGASTGRRRELRQAETDAELLLWQRLRARQVGGWKFRRQHSLGPFILDFYCAEASLAIELDGDQHADGPTREYDERRSAYLAMQWIRVLRFSDRDVLREPTSVLEAIVGALT